MLKSYQSDKGVIVESDVTQQKQVNPDLLGQRLLRAGYISEEDLEKALAFQKEFGGRLGAVLVRIGAVAEEKLLEVLSTQLGLALVKKGQIPLDVNSFLGVAERCHLAPDWMVDQETIGWADQDGLTHFVAKDPLNPMIREVIDRSILPQDQKWWLARNQDIDRAIEIIKQSIALSSPSEGDNVSHLRELAEEAPVVELVNNTFSQAFNEGASDIHIEPGERNFTIRYRIDGVLQSRLVLPRERFDAVASRIKLISGMDIAERRLPQDGRIALRLSGQDVDVRVSALPGVWGESMVMRLLPKERKSFKLANLGLEPDTMDLFHKWIHEPHGIVLVTGPTGSGKSTTLYAALEELNTGQGKIITIEDPVEYNISGISQVQVHAEIQFTFARALRSILRQDPDIIMVGEIRDLETGEIAIQAALTGHLVLSTLHTNDSLSAFTRLVDMGVEPFLVSSSVRGVLAQRLLRRLCSSCSTPDTPQKSILDHMAKLKERFPLLFSQPDNWRQAVGCPQCQGIGYKGRLGIHELANVSSEIQDAILNQKAVSELQRIAERQGYRTLREDGLLKARMGLTSVDEVLRVTGLDMREGDEA